MKSLVPQDCNYFPCFRAWTRSSDPWGYYRTDFCLCSATLFILQQGADSSLCCVTPTLTSLTLVKKCCLPQSSLQKASLTPIRVSQGAFRPHCSNLTTLAAHITAGGIGSKPHTNFPLLLLWKPGASPKCRQIPTLDLNQRKFLIAQHVKWKTFLCFSHLLPSPSLFHLQKEKMKCSISPCSYSPAPR